MSNSELIARLQRIADWFDLHDEFSFSEEPATIRKAADALQAVEPSELDKTADNNKVICPNCCHQFTAIPVNVQTRLQALERVPMTEQQAAKMARNMHTWPEKIEEVIRATEAHHGITPPESKG